MDRSKKNSEAPAGTVKRSQKHYPFARSPLQFSRQDWKEIFGRIRVSFADDHIGIVAAGVAFFAMLSIFPMLLATVSIYGIFSDPVTVEEQIQTMYQVMPAEVATIIGDQLRDIVVNSPTALGLGALISIIFAVGSAAKGMKAIMEGFNVAYKERETRNLVKIQVQAMLLTLGAVLTVISAIALIAILPAVLSIIGLATYSERLILIARWPLLAVIFVTGLAIVHRYAADRRNPKWRWVTLGSLVSTAMILLVSAGFAYFADNFGNFNETYGSIGGAIVLLLWLYLMSLSLLIGAEINAEVEHQTIADTTQGRKDKKMGHRGATMADTFPEPR